MQTTSILRKCLAVGIILPFIGTAVIPSINASINNQSIQERLPPATTKTIEVIRYEYKSDGSIEKKVLEVPQNEFRTFQSEFHIAKTTEEKLDLYKKYDLIPQNVSMETLRNNFNDYVGRVSKSKITIENCTQNLISEKVSKSNSYYKRILNTYCTVEADGIGSLRFGLGLSVILGRINVLTNYFLNFNFPSIDIIILRLSLMGGVETTGESGHQDCYGIYFLWSLIGFVGYCFIAPLFIVEQFLGFTIMTFAQAGDKIPYQLFN